MLCFCSVFCQKLLRKSSVLFFFGSVFIIGDTANNWSLRERYCRPEGPCGGAQDKASLSQLYSWLQSVPLFLQVVDSAICWGVASSGLRFFLHSDNKKYWSQNISLKKSWVPVAKLFVQSASISATCQVFYNHNFFKFLRGNHNTDLLASLYH